MTPQQAANYTLEHIFGPAEFWNAETQPEGSGVQYRDAGPFWDVTGQLALLPSQPGSTEFRPTRSGRRIAAAGACDFIEIP